MVEFKFETNGIQENEVMDCGKFYVSYNADACADIPSFRVDDGEETALCTLDDEFYILNGDFREDYIKLAPKGLEACIDFYKEKAPEFNSSWSTT